MRPRLFAAARRAGCLFWLALALLCAGCAGPHGLADYTAYAGTSVTNAPADYVAWLRQTRFTRGELDGLPRYALIVHHTESEELLAALGYDAAEIETIRTGYTDPNVLLIVRPRNGVPFILNEGMPGAGGISTQTAELGALGVDYAVHIGTAGLLGTGIPFERLVIADGSHKDGAAYLLSASKAEAQETIARPDSDLTAALAQAATALGLPHLRAAGYTMPIYYLQPSGLVRDLIARAGDGGADAPRFVEMEQAPFFMTARRMGMKAASVVVGADRAVLTADGLEQRFYEGDTGPWLESAIRTALLAFARIEAGRNAASALDQASALCPERSQCLTFQQ